MSAEVVTVVLSGRPGGTTHRAVEVLASLPPELRLIGGLAVMCRVGTPYRATVDLDALTRGLHSQHDVLSHLAMTAPGGGQYRFDNDLELDVIDVSPSDADELAAMLVAAGDVTDLELNLVAHTWAHDSAAPMDILVIDEHGVPLAEAHQRLVAIPSGLVAMKVTTVPLRASHRAEKRASDLYDIGRLLVLFGSRMGSGLASMPTMLSDVIAVRLRRWFDDPAGRDRTYRELRRFDDPGVDLDEVSDVLAELLPPLQPSVDWPGI